VSNLRRPRGIRVVAQRRVGGGRVDVS
jgi:hypothetical protein